MYYLHYAAQALVKKYMFVAFINGYLFVYLLSVYAPDYIINSNSVVLPFIFDKPVRNVDSLLSENINKQKNGSRILCWVMTSPDFFQTRAKHVKATWGSYCDILLFLSSESEDTLPVIGLPVVEGYETLWAKTKAAFYYVYKHHFDEADWFLKADDDTYVVVENLRYLLNRHSPNEAVYFGRRFRKYVEQGYMSGGAGYVLSREALRLFIEKGLKSFFEGMCHLGTMGAEDINMGECLSYTGVKAGDSRDQQHLETFHPYTVDLLIGEGIVTNKDWMYSYCYYPLQIGENCCSNHTISFHYVTPEIMYVYDYFVHVLEIYGTKNYVYKLEEGTNTSNNT